MKIEINFTKMWNWLTRPKQSRYPNLTSYSETYVHAPSWAFTDLGLAFVLFVFGRYLIRIWFGV